MNHRYKEYAPIVLRIGISLVFLWFGLTQLINPESFFGYIPDWVTPHDTMMIHEHPFQSAHNLPLTPHIIIMGNGILETIFSLLLILGLLTRIASLILAIHLFTIMLGLGYNDIAVRDFGLIIAAIVVFLNGPDKLSLDTKLKYSWLEKFL